MKLYRITKLSTKSLLPQDTSWSKIVLYCGYDRREARRMYHANTADEVFRGFGGKVIEIESVVIIDGNTDDFLDDEVESEVALSPRMWRAASLR